MPCDDVDSLRCFFDFFSLGILSDADPLALAPKADPALTFRSSLEAVESARLLPVRNPEVGGAEAMDTVSAGTDILVLVVVRDMLLVSNRGVGESSTDS